MASKDMEKGLEAAGAAEPKKAGTSPGAGAVTGFSFSLSPAPLPPAPVVLVVVVAAAAVEVDAAPSAKLNPAGMPAPGCSGGMALNTDAAEAAPVGRGRAKEGLAPPMLPLKLKVGREPVPEPEPGRPKDRPVEPREAPAPAGAAEEARAAMALKPPPVPDPPGSCRPANAPPVEKEGATVPVGPVVLGLARLRRASSSASAVGKAPPAGASSSSSSRPRSSASPRRGQGVATKAAEATVSSPGSFTTGGGGCTGLGNLPSSDYCCAASLSRVALKEAHKASLLNLMRSFSKLLLLP